MPARRAAKHAVTTRAGLRWRLRAWAAAHGQGFFGSLGRLARLPLPTLMTVAVIGIALALPAGLYVLLQNFQQVSDRWDGATQISVFLDLEARDADAVELAGQVRAWPQVADVQVLTRAQALEEFQSLSGFGEALDVLEHNPLPPVLIVRPDRAYSNPQHAESLRERLRALPTVDLAELDLQWVKRLYALTEIGRRAVLVIGGLLALAVLLIVGNTIRLDIENRREEIIIAKLIGATNAFIRRPFLYVGLWYGLLGGLLAWLLIIVSMALVAGPVRRLAGLYGSEFGLSALQGQTFLAVVLISALLGLGGSWLAVGRHLSSIEPA